MAAASTTSRPGRGAWGLAVLTAGLLATVPGCGGAETAILGIGNSGNHLGADELADEVARAFVRTGAVPEVDDALIRSLYDKVVEQARAGDPRATLIVLELARRQRAEKG